MSFRKLSNEECSAIKSWKVKWRVSFQLLPRFSFFLPLLFLFCFQFSCFLALLFESSAEVHSLYSWLWEMSHFPAFCRLRKLGLLIGEFTLDMMWAHVLSDVNADLSFEKKQKRRKGQWLKICNTDWHEKNAWEKYHLHCFLNWVLHHYWHQE